MSEIALQIEKSENVFFNDHHAAVSDDQTEILKGLQQKQKTIEPKYFYDTYGSELFEQITLLPEYYPTRTERAILTEHAHAIAEHCGQNSILIEPGSGSSEKVRLLINALKPKAYVPMDIATEFLQRSAVKLGEEFPWLDIHAVGADFAQLTEAPKDIPEGKRVIFYPGSTLGNMTPEKAAQFLSQLRRWVSPETAHFDVEHPKTTSVGGVLIGIDLHKPTAVLNAAYNDQQGITAQFNLNVLDNINGLMNANFDTANFAHKAFYNEQQQRIEMHLICQSDHIVRVAETGIAFARGETIHTENSYKYTLESFSSLIEKAGFKIKASWLDKKQLFSVHYLEVKSLEVEKS